MGIAEHMAAEQLQMLPHLAFGIESPTGIVQVDMLLGIQASILRGAKAIEGLGRVECGELLPERGQSCFLGRKLRMREWVMKFSILGDFRISSCMAERILPSISTPPLVTVSRGRAGNELRQSSPRARLASNLVQASACELEGVRCPQRADHDRLLLPVRPPGA